MADPGKMRQVRYEGYESLGQEEATPHTGSLLTFVYDIPYFGACGVFPPFHIANQIFLRGKAGGGMSPGTSWEPFTISETEYAALVEAIQRTPITEIKPHARYAFAPMKFDHSLDDIEEWLEWFRASCQKHRESWHDELRKAGAMS